jgi:HlyD family secretion protein
MFKYFLKHKIVSAIILIVMVVGGYYGYKAATKTPSLTKYTLASVEKGSLISYVSGTGQVAALDQIDVKPEVSGTVVSVSAVKDQAVKEGAVLVQLDARDARAAVGDAEIALESAEIELDEMLEPPDALKLLQAKNALAQAERDLEEATDAYETIEEDIENSLDDSYEDGYDQVSSAFYKLSDFMTDLRDIMGTSGSENENINAYKLILGSDSAYIERLEDDYAEAKELYDDGYASFREIFSDADRTVIYALICDTLNTTKSVYRALESARHMYNAITVTDYSQYRIASTVNSLKPKIESDTTSAFLVINSLEQTIDDIDDTVADAPDKIKNAELALKSAEEDVAEKKEALADLEAGYDSIDIRTQQNVVAQKGAALKDAREKLADTAIRAPFDGIIASIDVKKGDSVSSGAVATLITEQKLAEITLNEIDVADVSIGQKATITIDAVSDLSVTGEVAEVDSIGAVNQGVVTYAVKIVFDTQDERIKPGMSLSASIITGVKADVLMVPNSAVKTLSGSAYVEIFDDTASVKAASGTNGSSKSVTSTTAPGRQSVEVGASNDTMTEIVSGLNEGDEVVASTVKSSSSSSTTSTQNRSVFQMQGVGGPGLR